MFALILGGALTALIDLLTPNASPHIAGVVMHALHNMLHHGRADCAHAAAVVLEKSIPEIVRRLQVGPVTHVSAHCSIADFTCCQ